MSEFEREFKSLNLNKFKDKKSNKTIVLDIDKIWDALDK